MKLTSIRWQALIFLSIMSILVGGCASQRLPTTLRLDKTVLSLGEHTNIECTVSNSTGNMTYEWSCSGGGILGEGKAVDWFAPDKAGTYIIRVKVKADDGKGGTAFTTIAVMDNHTPVIEDLVFTPKNPQYFKDDMILRGQSLEIECVAQDEDGDELTYTWSCDHGDISGTGAKITWTAPSEACEATITVTASDGKGGTATENTVFQVKTCACAFR